MKNVVFLMLIIFTALIANCSPPHDLIITLNQKEDTLHHTVTNEVSGLFRLKGEDSLPCISFGGTKIDEPDWGAGSGMRCIAHHHIS